MDWLQTLVLALIQGLSEFLPISSSAHLVLPSQIFGWPDQGLAFDVAVHVGSLAAVMWYFRQDIQSIMNGVLTSLKGQRTPEGDLGWMVCLATVPALLAGFLFEDFIEANLRSASVIAYTTILGAIALAIADRWNRPVRDITEMTLYLALAIGCAQMLALIPGTSRSGATITMALLLGFQRVAAARFSFLLSIPIILAGGAWQTLGLLGTSEVPWGKFAVATIVSGLSAYACIHLFLKLIERIGMMPFVVYRLILGVGLLLLVA